MPSSQRSSYHHGALREELLAACVKLIETEGLAAVSLRRVAREAGVSPGAPYHHFADRSALLTAISVRGFELLAERLRAARAQAGSPLAALSALIHTYVGFAGEQPAYFQLMFRPELSQPQKHPDAHASGDAAFQVLTEVMTEVLTQVGAECERAGTAPPGDPATLIGMVWAIGHGLAALWLDGPLEWRCDQLGTSPAALTADITATLERMLLPRPR